TAVATTTPAITAPFPPPDVAPPTPAGFAADRPAATGLQLDSPAPTTLIASVPAMSPVTFTVFPTYLSRSAPLSSTLTLETESVSVSLPSIRWTLPHTLEYVSPAAG